jgi:hypothetical protein
MPASEPSRLIRFGRVIAGVVAMLGTAAVALWFLFVYGVIGYAPGVFGSVALLGASAYLVIRKRWVGLAIGGFCWLALATESADVWHPFLPPFGLIFITVACLVLDQIRRFPLSRLRTAGVLCSLALGAALALQPYALARFHGRSANLRNAELILADLEGADLHEADLRGADLRGAGLGGANLIEADLRRAKLAGALFDCRTRWPEGFDPQARGAQLDTWVDCCEEDEPAAK